MNVVVDGSNPSGYTIKKKTRNHTAIFLIFVGKINN